jgi:hypothetical protein
MADSSDRLFHELRARPVSGEHLEVLGKHASAAWQSGVHPTLSEAIVDTVKHAGLSPEQVRRVVEFANTDAYLGEFKKVGTHKVVDFPGGPADPAEILRSLNDSGDHVYDRGTTDYAQPPPDAKIASDAAERALTALFETPPSRVPFVHPLAEALDLRDKLAGAEEDLRASVCGLEGAYADVAAALYGHVKQAALEGAPLGDVVEAWRSIDPSGERVKIAFALVGPRLLREGVFASAAALLGSVDKVASAGLVNDEHPLVAAFAELGDVLTKLATARAAQDEVRTHLDHLTAFLKHAALAGDAYRAAARGSEAVSKAVSPLVGKAFGAGAETASRHALRHLHHAGLGLGASEAYTHLRHGQSPVARVARGGTDLVLRNVPGTEQNLRHQWELENGQ